MAAKKGAFDLVKEKWPSLQQQQIKDSRDQLCIVLFYRCHKVVAVVVVLLSHVTLHVLRPAITKGPVSQSVSNAHERENC